MGAAVLVGTRKGLFVLTSDETRREWAVEGPLLTGWEVFHAVRDPRDGALHATTNNWVYGATTHRSSDLGHTWERADEIGLAEETGLTWEKSWHVEPGHADEPGTLWLGGTPGALFRSGDGGASGELLTDGLPQQAWASVMREGMSFDRLDPVGIYVGLQSGSVFVSPDAGDSWVEGARYLPTILSVEACEWP